MTALGDLGSRAGCSRPPMRLFGYMSSSSLAVSWLAALNASSNRLVKTVYELPDHVLAQKFFTGDWTIAQVVPPGPPHPQAPQPHHLFRHRCGGIP
jgi:hypothetical protein